MSEVTYSRPWLLYAFAAHFGGIVAIVALAFLGARLGSAYPLIAIPFVLGGAIASTLSYWSAFNSPADFERGREARFISDARQHPQFRIYDDCLLLRQPVRGRIYTVRYTYDEILEVVYRPSSWKQLPFGETLKLVVLHEGAEMTIVAWTRQAERIAREIADAKTRVSAKTLVSTEGVNLPRRTAATAASSQSDG